MSVTPPFLPVLYSFIPSAAPEGRLQGQELAVTGRRYQVKRATSYEGKGPYKHPGIIICGIAWRNSKFLEF